MNPILIAAIPVIIHGNANGLWSPNASIPDLPTLPPRSQAIYHSPVHTTPHAVVEEPLIEIPGICPTIESRPELCQ